MVPSMIGIATRRPAYPKRYREIKELLVKRIVRLLGNTDEEDAADS